MSLVYSSLLFGGASYGMYYIPFKKYPFAFAACVIGCCHGIIGLTDVLLGYSSDEDNRTIKEVSTSILETAPLPLINLEFYLISQGTSIIALGHSIFVIPLVLDISCAIFRDCHECHKTQALKDLTILGNIISLAFLAFNEGNYLYGKMAIIAAFIKYGCVILDCVNPGTGEHLLVVGNGGFFYLCAKAIIANTMN